MKQRKQVFGLTLAALGAAVGYFLRRAQLGGSETMAVALSVFCAAVAVMTAVFCMRLSKRGDYMETFSSAPGYLVLSVAGGILIIIACAAEILERMQTSVLVLNGLGIAAGLCILAVAICRFRGNVPPVGLHILPSLYLVAKLILDFKQWSLDPAILDYCFFLFAAISAMCATYHLGGFCFGKGGRRISAFWCLMGTVFAGVCLADGGMGSMLTIGGFGLWLFANAGQLLEQ